MITIAWYNVVAIVITVAFIVLFNIAKKLDKGSFLPFWSVVIPIIWLLVMVIWGGIFWW